MKIIIDGVKETNWREMFDAGEIELCNLVDKLVDQMAEEKLNRITYGCITIENESNMNFKKQIADISDKLYVFQEDTECPAPACAVCEYVELCDRIMDLQTVIARFKNEGKL